MNEPKYEEVSQNAKPNICWKCQAVYLMRNLKTWQDYPNQGQSYLSLFGQNFEILSIVCCMMLLLALRQENLSMARFDDIFSAWRPPRKSRCTLTEIASSVYQDTLSDHSVIFFIYFLILTVCCKTSKILVFEDFECSAWIYMTKLDSTFELEGKIFENHSN